MSLYPELLNLKFRAFLTGYTVAVVGGLLYKKVITTCLLMIGYFFGAIDIASSEKKCSSDLFKCNDGKRQGRGEQG